MLTNEQILISAAKNGYDSIVRYLINNGMKFDDALCHAARNGHESIVRFLVGKGANIHIHDDEHCAMPPGKDTSQS